MGQQSPRTLTRTRRIRIPVLPLAGVDFQHVYQLAQELVAMVAQHHAEGKP